MKTFILTLVLFLFPIFLNAKTLEITFDSSKEKLPSNILINDIYYKKSDNIFFINRDYQKRYSQIVKYNVKNREIVDTIYTAKSGYIDDYDIGKEYIVWSVKKSQTVEIYCYNFIEDSLKDTIVINKPGNYPINLNLDDGKFAWLDHNFKEKVTQIKVFDIESGRTESISSYSHLDTRFKVPVFFLEFKDGKIFYDLQTGTGISIRVYSVNKREVIKEFRINEEFELHFSGSYNKDKNSLALYGKSRMGDTIYTLNLTTGRVVKLSGFYTNSYIYEDRILFNGNKIFYAVQKNASGEIKDHYYFETYNLLTMKMERRISYFNYFKTDNYLGLLKFDDGIKKVIFELYD